MKKVIFLFALLAVSLITSLKSVFATDLSYTFELPEYPLVKNDVEIVIIEKGKSQPANTCFEFTQEEIDLMARVVMSEASTRSLEVKQAVAHTIIARLTHEDYPNTIYDVVHDENAYYTGNNGEPNGDCYFAVESAIMYPDAFPRDMVGFRKGHYHTWGYHYRPIEDFYFTTLIDYNTGE